MSRVESCAQFYPYYLAEHSNRLCRRLHFIGSTLVILALLAVLFTGRERLLWLLPLFVYGCAWIGLYVYEKKRPETFQHPLYSLMGDWVMYAQMLRGRVSF